MSRGWARLLLLPLFGSAQLGCDLSVHPFSGTIIELSISGAQVSPPGSHLELWARDQFDDIIRVNGNNDNGDSPGLLVRKAITMNDPCMIDEHGNLLTTAAAYPADVVVNGQMQSRAQLATQVRERIAQLTDGSDANCLPVGTPEPRCGTQQVQLLAVVPYDPTTPPVIPFDAAPADRLSQCNAYWKASRSAMALAYTPNPAQLTSPAHGSVYGFIAFQTLQPPAGYDGIRLDSPTNLRGIKELFLTVETPQPGSDVNPSQRGPMLLDGFPDYGGRGFIHFDLAGTGVSGAAALLVDADKDPVQF